MSTVRDRQQEVNDSLLALEEDAKGVGHITLVSLDFIETIPHDDSPPVVDKHGQFILVADVVLKFLVYESTVEADLVRGLRDAADQLEQHFQSAELAEVEVAS